MSEIAYFNVRSAQAAGSGSKVNFSETRPLKIENKSIAKNYHISEKSVEYHLTKARNYLRKFKEYLTVIILF
jgi:hypothetical protein